MNKLGIWLDRTNFPQHGETFLKKLAKLNNLPSEDSDNRTRWLFPVDWVVEDELDLEYTFRARQPYTAFDEQDREIQVVDMGHLWLNLDDSTSASQVRRDILSGLDSLEFRRIMPWLSKIRRSIDDTDNRFLLCNVHVEWDVDDKEKQDLQLCKDLYKAQNVLFTSRVVEPGAFLSEVFASELNESWGMAIMGVVGKQKTDLEKRIREQLIELRNTQQEAGRLRFLFEAGSSAVSTVRDTLFSNLKQLPMLERVYMLPTGLGFVTKEVFVEYEGRTYFVGKYEFRISLKGGILARNLMTPDGGKLHPHGWADSVCLGSYETQLSNAFGSFDYETVTLTLLDFLQSISKTDGTGRNNLESHYKSEDELSSKEKSKRKTFVSRWFEFLTYNGTALGAEVAELNRADRPVSATVRASSSRRSSYDDEEDEADDESDDE